MCLGCADVNNGQTRHGGVFNGNHSVLCRLSSKYCVVSCSYSYLRQGNICCAINDVNSACTVGLNYQILNGNTISSANVDNTGLVLTVEGNGIAVTVQGDILVDLEAVVLTSYQISFDILMQVDNIVILSSCDSICQSCVAVAVDGSNTQLSIGVVTLVAVATILTGVSGVTLLVQCGRSYNFFVIVRQLFDVLILRCITDSTLIVHLAHCSTGGIYSLFALVPSMQAASRLFCIYDRIALAQLFATNGTANLFLVGTGSATSSVGGIYTLRLAFGMASSCDHFSVAVSTCSTGEGLQTVSSTGSSSGDLLAVVVSNTTHDQITVFYYNLHALIQSSEAICVSSVSIFCKYIACLNSCFAKLDTDTRIGIHFSNIDLLNGVSRGDIDGLDLYSTDQREVCAIGVLC